MKQAFNAWKTQSYNNQSSIQETTEASLLDESQMNYIKQTVQQEIATQLLPIKNMIRTIYNKLAIQYNEEAFSPNPTSSIHKDIIKEKSSKGQKMQLQLQTDQVKVESESSYESQMKQIQDSQQQSDSQSRFNNLLQSNTWALANTKQEWEQMYALIKNKPNRKTGWSNQFKKNVVIFVDSGLRFGYNWKKLVQIAGVSQSSYKRWKKMQ